MQEPANDHAGTAKVPEGNSRPLSLSDRVRSLRLPERTSARIKKPVGVTDPTPYWKALYTVVQDADQATTQGPTEVFSGVSKIPETCAYDELQTSLTVSVQ